MPPETEEQEGVFLPGQRGDKDRAPSCFFSSARWPGDSRGPPLVWLSSISQPAPSCGAYLLLQQASAVAPRARKCLQLWRQFVFLQGSPLQSGDENGKVDTPHSPEMSSVNMSTLLVPLRRWQRHILALCWGTVGSTASRPEEPAGLSLTCEQSRYMPH